MKSFFSKLAMISLFISSSAFAQDPAEVKKTDSENPATVKSENPAKPESAASEVEKSMDKKKKHHHKKHGRVKIGAEFHGNWNMDLRDEENGGNDIKESTFNVTRMYITAKAKVASWLTARTTMDFGYFLDGATKHDPNLGYIKYAFFKATVAPDQYVLFGTQPRVWVGTMDDIMGYRYVMKSSMDHFGLFPSADTGVSYSGKYMNGLINVSAGIFNGSGYKDPAPGESIQNNLMEARVTVIPFAGNKDILKGIGAHFYFGTKGYQQDDGTGNMEDMRANVFGTALSFNHEMVDFLVEFMMIKNGQDGDKGQMVISPYIAVKYQKFALFANYAMYKDSNLDTDDTWTRIAAGLSWKPRKNFALSVNYQMEGNSKFGGTGSDKSAIFVSTMFKY